METRNRRADSKAWFVAGLFAAAGLIALAVYRRMPLVRNSLVYASIVYNMIDLGPAFKASRHAFNKPLGFAYLSYPWVKLWGANAGLMVSSWIFASLWSLSLVPFYRRFSGRFGIPAGRDEQFVLLACANPLFFYQFLSAYPDLLYALSLLWAFIFLDRLLSEEAGTADGVMFAAALLFAVWVKHNGFILIPILLIFLAVRWRTVVLLWQQRRAPLLVATASLAAVLLVLLMALRGHDLNLFNFSRNRSNLLSGGDRLGILGINLKYFGLYLVLSFNLLLPWLLLPARPGRLKEWYLALAVIMAPLWFYWGTRDNIRYYLQISPFLLLFIMGAMEDRSRSLVRPLTAAAAAIGLCLLTVYNIPFVHSRLAGPLHLPAVDNLRLTNEQLAARHNIALINRIHRQEGYDRLIFITNYYRKAAWGIWERDGFFDPGLKVTYAGSWSRKLLGSQDTRIILYDNKHTVLRDGTVKPFLRRRSAKVFSLDFDNQTTKRRRGR